MRRGGLLLVLALALSSCGPPTPPPGFHVLVFTRTAGFTHDSIPAGVAAIRELGRAQGFAVDASADPGLFTPARLRRYAVVVFLNTTGDVLAAEQERAFEGYVRGGGGFVGVHAAADTEYGWGFYARLVGAHFKDHPEVQTATVRVRVRDHPATAHLPEAWQRVDEWYSFREALAPGVRVLLVLDGSSYRGGPGGGEQPHAWAHELDGGRSFYTAGGHTVESYREEAFRRHLLGGIRYAAGRA